ncbi:hypothetical protein KSF_048620 [Reticulibacter mediterranei]|uniref:Uncharacterized protein n=1 Tax=Reticulibacter mediterranei TaxID=2778369 RepID=A0A8J3IG34_9CHLR|nr:hypothetical protein KSF_048620 [Reticulibacter mediterranei]
MKQGKHTRGAVGSLTYQKHLDTMTVEEGIAWLMGMKERLTSKQQRERRYLDRRAARGTQTPTDDAYEQDQVLESELLALLEGLIDQFQRDMTGGQR